MAQYPVESDEQLFQAVNYLLSGPGGLGQDFQGFSSYTTAYITGNFRVPYTNPNPRSIYVAPIACSSVTKIDNRTFQYNFTAAQPSPPFITGNPVIGAGFSDSFFNGSWAPIGVVDCTTTTVTVRTSASYPAQSGSATGGTIEYNINDIESSTDCNARVVVNGGTDRVFLSAQLNNEITYTSSAGGNLTYRVRVNRYVGYPNNDPVNPDYLFDFDGVVSSRTYTYTGLTGSATLTNQESIFSTLIDSPLKGYYWYILEITLTPTGDVQPTQSKFGLRSLSAQVVKQ